MRRDLIVAISCTFCLTVALFMIMPANSILPYDPWVDINDDGNIDGLDIIQAAARFGASGTPMNKTEILLELQTSRAHEETYSTTVETISGYGGLYWQDMPAMSVSMTLETEATLLITFSVQAMVYGTQWIYVRAMVDATNANPSAGITLTGLNVWNTHSFTFYLPGVSAGVHTVKIQWSIYDEVGSGGSVAARTLVVTAQLP